MKAAINTCTNINCENKFIELEEEWSFCPLCGNILSMETDPEDENEEDEDGE